MHLTASAIPLRKIAHTTQSLTQLIRIAGVRQALDSLPFHAECRAGHHAGPGSGGSKGWWRSGSVLLAVAEIVCFVQKQAFEIVYFVHLVS